MFAYCNNSPVNYSDPNGYAAGWTNLVNNCDGGTTGQAASNQADKRDVTDEVMSALNKACHRAKIMRHTVNALGLVSTAAEAIIYMEFYDLVNHGAPWDIKREKPWQDTIGTPYPGYNAEVTFNGMTMTPEMLGNYTYGYLGYAYGIPLILLIAGSYYAADFPTTGAALSNELWDWGYIARGYQDAN